MPEFRKDPISGRSVIVAEERAHRPNDFIQETSPDRRSDATSNFCPFCPGHESCTPHEVDACRDDGLTANDPNWRVRVIPNKFPALSAQGSPIRASRGLYESITGIGIHEVIIESPRHLHSVTELSKREFSEVLAVYRGRLIELKKDARLAHGLIFKNVGSAAGASLEHIHSQLIAMPEVPRLLLDELAGSQTFFAAEKKCIFCEMIAQEIDQQRRIVIESPKFIAFCPYASRFPFETWILPKRHASGFETLTDLQIPDLAEVIQSVIEKIEVSLHQSAYNYIIHSAPFDTRQQEHYHWHIEIIPRSTSLAGFEMGTGLNINPMSPEAAAEQMRQVSRSRLDA